MIDERRGSMFILFSFLLWSTTGVFLREAGLPLMSFIVIANSAGIACLLIVRRRGALKGILDAPRAKLLALSLAATVNVFTSFEAFLRTSIANVLFIHYFAPVLVAFFSPLVLKEKPAPKTLFALGLSIVGLVLVFRSGAAMSEKDATGMLLALVSAFAYTIVVLIARGLSRDGGNAISLTLSQSIVMLVVAILLILARGESFFHGQGMDYFGARSLALATFAGILHLAVAAWLYMVGIRWVTASVAGVLGYTEVIFGMGWGYLFYGEAISEIQGLGAILILTGGFVIFFGKPGPMAQVKAASSR